MSKRVSISISILALTLIVATSGCAKPQPAGLTDAQVGTTLTNILQALNSNDYQGFKQDFSDAMVNAFSQDQFTKLHDLIQTTSGNYLSMGTPSLLNQNGYVVYRFPCKFDKENVIATLTFLIGGTKVEGLFFDSTALRAATK